MPHCTQRDCSGCTCFAKMHIILHICQKCCIFASAMVYYVCKHICKKMLNNRPYISISFGGNAIGVRGGAWATLCSLSPIPYHLSTHTHTHTSAAGIARILIGIDASIRKGCVAHNLMFLHSVEGKCEPSLTPPTYELFADID